MSFFTQYVTWSQVHRMILNCVSGWGGGEVKWSESRSAMSDSVQPHGLHSPWDSPGHNTGVGSCSLLQGVFPTRDQTQVSRIADRFFTNRAAREAQEYWSG